jgi:hypothetical protein
MLQKNVEAANGPPIKRAHYVGSSIVITIDREHIKRLNIDGLTFFIQKPIENGIILEMRKIDTNTKNRIEENEVYSHTLVQGSRPRQSKANHNHDKQQTQQAKV